MSSIIENSTIIQEKWDILTNKKYLFTTDIFTSPSNSIIILSTSYTLPISKKSNYKSLVIITENNNYYQKKQR